MLASLDELDFDGRQRLLRMVVEKVRVTGWRVEIHLKIPITDDDTGTQREPRPPKPDPGPSSDMDLIPFMQIDGDSYRMRSHRARLATLRAGLHHPAEGGEFSRSQLGNSHDR